MAHSVKRGQKRYTGGVPGRYFLPFQSTDTRHLNIQETASSGRSYVPRHRFSNKRSRALPHNLNVILPRAYPQIFPRQRLIIHNQSTLIMRPSSRKS